MAGIYEEDTWLVRDSETKEEREQISLEHKKLCEENKKKMTPQEYQDWINFFD